MAKRILIVEDEIVSAMALGKMLKELGYDVLGIVTTGEEAIERARMDHPDIVAMDIRLAGKMDGIDAATEIAKDQDTQIVFMTGYSDDETRKRALALKPLGLMDKPIGKSQLEKLK
jgi:two-component system, response regulator PdtaR